MKTRTIKPRKHAWLPLALLVLISACGLQAPQEETESAPVLVRVQETAVMSHSVDLDFPGAVQAYEEAHIGAGAPMRIERILVDVGDQVEKGQLLVQMDRTQLFQAMVQKQTLQNDLRRLDTLLQMGAVTRQQYDQLLAQYDIAVSTIENLEQNTEIRAPISGVVTGRYSSEGELFSMTPGPAGKPAILSLMQIAPVKITIGISERYFPVVQKGQEAVVTAEAFPGRQFSGRVERIHPTIDRSSGTFRVEVVVANRDQSLRPGMFSRVSLNMGQAEGLLVPALSVLKQVGSNERYVYVVEDGRAVRKSVIPGRNYDDRLEILQGLEPGEILVTTGQHNLRNHSEVAIVD